MKLAASIAVTLASLLGATAGAQTPSTPPAPVVTAQQKPSQHGHVIVPVLIHDKKGRLIPNLTAADFSLTDNTHPQTIQFFAPDTSLPLTLGIAAQTGPGMSASLPTERRAAQKFLTQLMSGSSSRVQAFVLQYNLDVDLLEDPSSSTAKLHQALSQIGVPQFSNDTNGTYTAADFSKHKHRKRAGGAALYDAIYLASSQVFNKESGRKALIVFSDGIDRGSKATLNSAIEAAQTHGVAVYAVYFKGAPPPEEFRRTINRHPGLGYPGTYPGGYPGGGYPGGPGSTQPPPPQPTRRVDGRHILAEICGRTGGEMFNSKRAKLDTLLAQIAHQMNHAYILAYTRPKADNNSGFHHIRLKPKQKDHHVQITEGYWLPQK